MGSDQQNYQGWRTGKYIFEKVYLQRFDLNEKLTAVMLALSVVGFVCGLCVVVCGFFFVLFWLSTLFSELT